MIIYVQNDGLETSPQTHQAPIISQFLHMFLSQPKNAILSTALPLILQYPAKIL